MAVAIPPMASATACAATKPKSTAARFDEVEAAATKSKPSSDDCSGVRTCADDQVAIHILLWHVQRAELALITAERVIMRPLSRVSSNWRGRWALALDDGRILRLENAT